MKGGDCEPPFEGSRIVRRDSIPVIPAEDYCTIRDNTTVDDRTTGIGVKSITLVSFTSFLHLFKVLLLHLGSKFALSKGIHTRYWGIGMLSRNGVKWARLRIILLCLNHILIVPLRLFVKIILFNC